MEAPTCHPKMIKRGHETFKLDEFLLSLQIYMRILGLHLKGMHIMS
jgi:hypothetical protein